MNCSKAVFIVSTSFSSLTSKFTVVTTKAFLVWSAFGSKNSPNLVLSKVKTSNEIPFGSSFDPLISIFKFFLSPDFWPSVKAFFNLSIKGVSSSLGTHPK